MSYHDAREVPDGQTLEADVCIVGGGAAGLALASALGESTEVVLLESGGFAYDERTQRLYDGRVLGRDYPLAASRLRYFGGTTNHWGGNVRPLEEIDFEPREWVPHSGWPIRRADLDPYYDRARVFFHMPEDSFVAEAWEEGEKCRPWPLDSGGLENEIFPAVAPEERRLGKTRRDEIGHARNIRTLLQANVLELETGNPPRRVEHVRVATFAGNRFRVNARTYVLAAGGIENARLLLASARNTPAGLGNDHDLVGRFFADHLVVPPIGDLLLSDTDRPLDFYRGHPHRGGGAVAQGVFRLPDDVQRAHRLQNLRVQLGPALSLDRSVRRGQGYRSLVTTLRALGEGHLPGQFEWHVANVIEDFDEIVVGSYELARYRGAYPTWYVDLIAIAEPAPNPDSRVRLGDDVDELGQRRIILEWRPSPSDQDTVRRSTALLARELALAGVGRVRDLMPRGGFAKFRPSSHKHHMGTTRMHDDPKQGVVDRNCRMHGIDNLYVAGSSVFPTFGHANPTFTIVALALRLGDHLRGNLA